MNCSVCLSQNLHKNNVNTVLLFHSVDVSLVMTLSHLEHLSMI